MLKHAWIWRTSFHLEIIKRRAMMLKKIGSVFFNDLQIACLFLWNAVEITLTSKLFCQIGRLPFESKTF